MLSNGQAHPMIFAILVKSDSCALSIFSISVSSLKTLFCRKSTFHLDNRCIYILFDTGGPVQNINFKNKISLLIILISTTTKRIALVGNILSLLKNMFVNSITNYSKHNNICFVIQYNLLDLSNALHMYSA